MTAPVVNPEVTITEEWDDDLGRFTNYDIDDVDQRQAVLQKKHINIRSLVQVDEDIPRRMIVLDGYTIDYLDSLTMQDLDDEVITRYGEQWVGGVIGPEASLDNRPTLTITCPGGTTSAYSVIQDPANLGVAIDLEDLSGFDPGDTVSVALPAFPLASVTLSSCFLDLTSDVAGSFATHTVSIPFSASLSTIVAGNSEFSFAYSDLDTPTYLIGLPFDKTAVTGVRVRIFATGATTVKVAAIRVLADLWQSSAYDMDTRYERLVPTVSRIGNLTFDFVWPTMFRSFDPAGREDPRPINSKLTCAFNTGAMTEGTNTLIFYLRWRSEDFITQTELDGSFTQQELEDYGSQLDFGRELFAARSGPYIASLTQAELDAQNDFDIQNGPDPASLVWTEVDFSWDGASTGITIKDNDTLPGDEYVFAPSILTANSDYLLVIDLEEHTMRVQIYPLDDTGQVLVDDIFFDSMIIVDDSMFKRRKGRIGWSIDLADGDAFLDNVRTASLMFAEYRSHALQSSTPVAGIELFVSATPNKPLCLGLEAGPFGGSVAADVNQSNSADGSIRIDNPGNALYGIMTNSFVIENFSETGIQFDIFFPKKAMEAGADLNMFLLNSRDRIILLPFPRILPDRWQTVKISGIASQEQTGGYRLVLLQTLANIPTTWWIDNVSVFGRGITWSTRPNEESNWINFRDTFNLPGSGVRFAERGFATQVRGQALRQGAYIERVAFKPKYAELGRFVWADEEIEPTTPVASGSGGRVLNVVTLDGTGSTAPGGFIIDYTWNFGDGSFAKGPIVVHTYAGAAPYTAYLTITDDRGFSSTDTVVVA